MRAVLPHLLDRMPWHPPERMSTTALVGSLPPVPKQKRGSTQAGRRRYAVAHSAREGPCRKGATLCKRVATPRPTLHKQGMPQRRGSARAGHNAGA